MNLSNKTGTARIGDDWAGVFIGGQDAGSIRWRLTAIATETDDPSRKAFLLGLCDVLASCAETSKGDIRTKYTLK